MNAINTARHDFESLSHSWRGRLVWSTVLWIVLFWRLGYPSLLDPDEAHYAQLTREMMRSHQWLVPLLDGTPYIDKPVFFHWLQAMFVSLLGPTEFALRLPSALAALALTAIVKWMGGELFSRRVGTVAALMFATLPLTFALSSVAIFDMLYVTFLFGGVCCIAAAALRARTSFQYPGYLLIALAVMTKGPVALLLCTLFFATAVLASRTFRDGGRQLHWARGLAIIVTATSPWFVWMWLTFGQRFIADYVIAGNLWYFTNPLEFSPRNSGILFYGRAFLAGFFPWSLVAIGGGLDTLRSWRTDAPTLERGLLWLWVAIVVAFFSAAGFKVDYYIFPAAPACCLLAAAAWERASSKGRYFWTSTSFAAIAAVLVLAGAITSVMLFRLNLGLDVTAALLPLTLLSGGMALIVHRLRGEWRTTANVAALLGTLLAIYSLVVLVGFPVLERSRPTAALGAWVAAHTSTDDVVGQYGLDDWRASIRYYTDRRVTRLRSAEDLQAFLETPHGSYVLMLRDDFESLRSLGLPLEAVRESPAIVGRTGKFLRRQVWGDLLVVAPRFEIAARQ